MKEKVEEVLNEIRKQLQTDGGDVKLIDVTEDGTVKVELTGACGHCPMSQITLQFGIEKVLKQKIPQVKKVVTV